MFHVTFVAGAERCSIPCNLSHETKLSMNTYDTLRDLPHATCCMRQNRIVYTLLYTTTLHTPPSPFLPPHSSFSPPPSHILPILTLPPSSPSPLCTLLFHHPPPSLHPSLLPPSLLPPSLLSQCVRCSDCLRWFHKGCVREHQSLGGRGTWRCVSCTKCISCKTTSPGPVGGGAWGRGQGLVRKLGGL